MIGGIYFAGAPFAGALKFGAAAAALSAQVSIGLTSTANLSEPPFRMEAAATTIEVLTARADLRVPIDTSAGQRGERRLHGLPPRLELVG